MLATIGDNTASANGTNRLTISKKPQIISKDFSMINRYSNSNSYN